MHSCGRSVQVSQTPLELHRYQQQVSLCRESDADPLLIPSGMVGDPHTAPQLPPDDHTAPMYPQLPPGTGHSAVIYPQLPPPSLTLADADQLPPPSLTLADADQLPPPSLTLADADQLPPPSLTLADADQLPPGVPSLPVLELPPSHNPPVRPTAATGIGDPPGGPVIGPQLSVDASDANTPDGDKHDFIAPNPTLPFPASRQKLTPSTIHDATPSGTTNAHHATAPSTGPPHTGPPHTTATVTEEELQRHRERTCLLEKGGICGGIGPIGGDHVEPVQPKETLQQGGGGGMTETVVGLGGGESGAVGYVGGGGGAIGGGGPSVEDIHPATAYSDDDSDHNGEPPFQEPWPGGGGRDSDDDDHESTFNNNGKLMLNNNDY